MVTANAGTKQISANKLRARRIAKRWRTNGVNPPVVVAARGTKISPKLADAPLLPRKARGMRTMDPTLSAEAPAASADKLSQVVQTTRLRLKPNKAKPASSDPASSVARAPQ